MAARKSWTEKLKNPKNLPKIKKITAKMSKRWGKGTLLIPASLEVGTIMKKISEGKLITISELRETLAKKHGATICCPMTTGVFVWIAANAEDEQRGKGIKDIIPYWRTLKSDGSLNPKYSEGIDAQKFYLEEESHKIIKKGKKYYVSNYKQSIYKF